MSARATLATAARVLRQIRHDPRTLALLLLVPALLVTLLWWVLADLPSAFDAVGGPLVGLFPFITMFLVTSVAMLRERSTGTLERLLAMPLGKADLLLGYALAFGGLAVVQGGIVAALVLGPLDLAVAGPPSLLVLVAVLDALLGVAIGLGMSAFARTEFQAVQFLPAVVLPQLLLCGLVLPRDTMPAVLAAVSDVLPLSYAVDAMRQITRTAEPAVATELTVMTGFLVLFLALGSLTLRRRTA